MKNLTLKSKLLTCSILLCLFFIQSCRKDTLLNKNEIELSQAQQWFDKNALSVKHFISIEGKSLVPMEERAIWSEAVKTVLEDGTSVITVPVESNVFRIIGQKEGNLQLVMESKGDSYLTRYIGGTKTNIANKPVKELHRLAFSNKADANISLKSVAPINDGQIEPPVNVNNSMSGNCTDWYWVTKEYFNGELVSELWESMGTTCDEMFTGGGGNGGTGGDGSDGDFGEDPSCLNCKVSGDNFLSLKAYVRAAGLSIYMPYQGTVTLADGSQYNGIIIEIRAANGKLLASYFSPNTNSSVFETGYYYNIGNKGPDGTSNPNTNIISPNGAIWNFGTSIPDGGGSGQTTYTRSAEFITFAELVGLTASEILFLDDHPNIFIELKDYLDINVWTPENKQFANWAVGYLIENINTSFNEIESSLINKSFDLEIIQNTYLPRDNEPNSYYWRPKLVLAKDFNKYLELIPLGTKDEDLFNCHYHAFGKLTGSTAQPGSPNWILSMDVSSTYDKVVGNIQVGDRIGYYGPNNDGTGPAWTHSGIVTEVDANGYATKVSSKLGPFYNIIEHHPRDISPFYGSNAPTFTIDIPATSNTLASTKTYPSRIYWRKK